MTSRSREERPVRRLTHVDEHGKAHMVDVSGKPVTRRVAEARCSVRSVGNVTAVLDRPPGGADLIETARIAGIMAAKRTPTLVPLCHPLLLDGFTVDVAVVPHGFEVRAVTSVAERTGVEMEALTACAAAALVLVQALLEVDPCASVEDLTLWHKSGGRSGVWQRPVDGGHEREPETWQQRPCTP
jgi:cyclic pyranopterin phosphate synthase